MEEVCSPNFDRRLRAAEGYMELGMPVDAHAELEEIAPESRDHSDVLALKVRIYRSLEKWESMQAVARTLAFRDPQSAHWVVSWAFASRRADSINTARLILLEAVERLPGAAVLHYNLACYECLLGDVEVARGRLKHAIGLDGNLRAKAIDEEDLKAIWE